MGVTLALPTLPSIAANPSEAEKAPRRLVCIGNYLGYYRLFLPKDHTLKSPTLQPLRPH